MQKTDVLFVKIHSEVLSQSKLEVGNGFLRMVQLTPLFYMILSHLSYPSFAYFFSVFRRPYGFGVSRQNKRRHYVQISPTSSTECNGCAQHTQGKNNHIKPAPSRAGNKAKSDSRQTKSLSLTADYIKNLSRCMRTRTLNEVWPQSKQ